MSERERIYHVGNYNTDPTLIEWEKAHDKVGQALDAELKMLKEEATAFEAACQKRVKPFQEALDASWDSLYAIMKAKGVTTDLESYNATVNRETGDISLYKSEDTGSGIPEDIKELLAAMKAKGAKVHIERVEKHSDDCPANPDATPETTLQ